MVSRAEYIKVTAGLVTTAFAFVAGLAWNQAILSIFKAVLGNADSVPANVSYAIIVTIVAVIVTVWIARAASKAAGEEVTAEMK